MEQKLIDIRLTPEFIKIADFEAATFIKRLFQRLKGWTARGLETPSGQEYEINQYVIGKEHKDKYGRETHHHIHIAVIVTLDKTTKQTKAFIQEFLRKNGAKGNAAYMVRVNADVADEDRWFRYAMKQGDYETDYIGHEALANLAADEYKNQVKRNLETEEQARCKNQFRDKMYNHLDKKEIRGTRNIMIEIYNFYNSNARDAPLHDLFSKAMNYEINKKHRNIEDIFLINKSNENYYI